MDSSAIGVLLVCIPNTIILGILIFKNIRNVFRMRSHENILEDAGDMTISEYIFLILAPGFGFALNNNVGNYEAPFSNNDLPAIIFLYFIAIASFFISKYGGKKLTTNGDILINASMLQGLILCLVMSIHFGLFLALGIVIPFLGLPLISPLFAIILFSKELYRNYLNGNKLYSLPNPVKTNSGTQVFILARLSLSQRILVLFLALAPIFVFENLLISLSGLSPYSFYHAFTDTYQYTFSKH